MEKRVTPEKALEMLWAALDDMRPWQEKLQYADEFLNPVYLDELEEACRYAADFLHLVRAVRDVLPWIERRRLILALAKMNAEETPFEEWDMILNDAAGALILNRAEAVRLRKMMEKRIEKRGVRTAFEREFLDCLEVWPELEDHYWYDAEDDDW